MTFATRYQGIEIPQLSEKPASTRLHRILIILHGYEIHGDLVSRTEGVLELPGSAAQYQTIPDESLRLLKMYGAEFDDYDDRFYLLIGE